MVRFVGGTDWTENSDETRKETPDHVKMSSLFLYYTTNEIIFIPF